MTETTSHPRTARPLRLDAALVAGGHFESRAKAQEAISVGLVTIDGQVAWKAAALVGPAACLAATAPYPWVSRGGVKLAAALDRFGIGPEGRICLDVGASTGGFTEVLLSRGASHVHAVDVGRGQLHARIATDPRVTDRSATDIRQLGSNALQPAPSLVTLDVSFISLTLVLPAALSLADPTCEIVALIKPQFEVGRGMTAKGIVRDEVLRQKACERVSDTLAKLGATVLGLMPSPIEGGDGNHEYLIAARRP